MKKDDKEYKIKLDIVVSGRKFSALSLAGAVQLGVVGLKKLERQKWNSEAAPSNFGYLEISKQLLLL